MFTYVFSILSVKNPVKNEISNVLRTKCSAAFPVFSQQNAEIIQTVP